MPAFYPENNNPSVGDSEQRSLHKINDVLHGLGIPAHDHITFNPPANPTTITYRRGGASGVVVATMTLTYSGDDVATVAVSFPD